jgi:hypothetical protein
VKKHHLLFFFFSLLFISACRSERPPVEATVPPSITPVEAISSPTSISTIAATTSEEATATQTPTEPASLPQPTLIANPWDNLEIFIDGLTAPELGVLDELTGASVYHILLQIEDLTTLIGQMEMRYSNQETTSLDELYFHLFPNQLGGGITISDITINGQAVQPAFESQALRIPLQTPLSPGEEVVIAMDFVTTVPQKESTKYNILAYDEDILALAHFYPMMAVFDEDGWHIEPSPPHGDETYADMSYYLVQVTAPSEQTIVSSGVKVDESEADNVQNVSLAAGPVRDFYLVMSDRFEVVSNKVGSVLINSYAPEEFLDGAELALNVTSEALRSFSQRYGPYPYTELDIVSTPTLALGVEYPGIFANALRIYDLDRSAASGNSNAINLEATTAHETGHQWFYNLVGNDQLNEPWLDEALTQYATWTYFIDRYGQENAQGFYDSLEGRWSRTDFAEIPIGLPADQYSGADYGAIVYGRGPIFLNELAGTMGQETFDNFIRDYVETFRWQIATTEDFQTLAEEHCQCDLGPLFNEWVYGQ